MSVKFSRALSNVSNTNMNGKIYNIHTKSESAEDKKTWKKNWFDVQEELKSANSAQRNGMIAAYIKKIDSYGPDDITKLLYTLRVRALILIFFNIEEIESGTNKNLHRWRSFLSRDLSTHGGWTDRSNEEDSIIGEYQYAYALCESGNNEEGGIVFTSADKKFGAVRHARYLATLVD